MLVAHDTGATVVLTACMVPTKLLRLKVPCNRGITFRDSIEAEIPLTKNPASGQLQVVRDDPDVQRLMHTELVMDINLCCDLNDGTLRMNVPCVHARLHL